MFYTSIVINDCWEERQKQRDPGTFLDGIEDAREKILHGKFPKSILEQFWEMFDYLGQTPITVPLTAKT